MLFLCSDVSSFTTGSSCAVDGGYLAPLREAAMTEVIRIDDLAAPVLNDVQRMGIDYGDSKHTELSVDAVCAAAMDAHGTRGLRPRRLPRAPRRAAGRDGRRRGAHRARPAADVRRLRPLRVQSAADPRPADAATPRSSTSRSRARSSSSGCPVGHHAPRQPAGRRHPLPLAAAVGVLRAGARSRRADRADGIDPRWTRCRGDVGGHGGGGPTGGGHASDGARPRPRGDRAAAARLLELQRSSGSPGRRCGATTTWPTTRRRTTPT